MSSENRAPKTALSSTPRPTAPAPKAVTASSKPAVPPAKPNATPAGTDTKRPRNKFVIIGAVVTVCILAAGSAILLPILAPGLVSKEPYSTDPASVPLNNVVSPKGRIQVDEPQPDAEVPGNPLHISGTFAGSTDAVKLEIVDADNPTVVLFSQTIKPRKDDDERVAFSSSIAWSRQQTIEIRISILDENAKTEHVRVRAKVVPPLTPVVPQAPAPSTVPPAAPAEPTKAP